MAVAYENEQGGFIRCSQNVVWRCVAEINTAFPDKDVIWMTAYVASKPVYIVHALCTKTRY